MTRSRRRFEDKDKLAVVRRHLIDKVPVSDLCDELKKKRCHGKEKVSVLLLTPLFLM